MDVRAAVAAAKQHIAEKFATDSPDNLRLEEFIYDDHLGFWSLTIGFTPSDRPRERCVVRVMESDKSIVSVTASR